MHALAAATRLRRLAAALRAHERVPLDDAVPIANAIDLHLQSGINLETALGLKAEAGHLHWRTQAKIARRDQFLRDAARQFCESNTVRGQAVWVANKLHDYETTGWVRERLLDECPSHRKKHVEGLLWQALNQYPRAVRWDRLQRILVAKG
jgi:hypothetical protein